MLKMDLRSFLPYLKISGLYDLEGVALGVFPLFGSGPYDVEVFDLVMLGGGDLDLDASGQYLQVPFFFDFCSVFFFLAFFYFTGRRRRLLRLGYQYL